MRCDVADALGGDPGVGDGADHALGHPSPGRRRIRHAVGVHGGGVSGDLAQDRGAAAQGGLALLEHEHDPALAEHEARAVVAEGPGGALGLIGVVLGQRSQQGEAQDVEPGHERVVAAGQGRIGLALLDLAEGLADRVPGGGAGRRDGLHRSAEAGLSGQHRGRDVLVSAQHVLDQRPVQGQLGLDPVEELGHLLQVGTPGGGADHHGAAAGLLLVAGGGQPGAAQRLEPGGHAEGALPGEQLGLGDVGHQRAGILHGHRAGDAHRVGGGVELGDLPDAAAPGHQGLERRLSVQAQRGHGTGAGDHHAAAGGLGGAHARTSVS